MAPLICTLELVGCEEHVLLLFSGPQFNWFSLENGGMWFSVR